MLVNSISSQRNNFNGNWQKASFKAIDSQEALKIIDSIRQIVDVVPKKQKVYIRSVGDKEGLDISQLGGLGCISILANDNFEYRVTGRKYPKVILKALKDCFSCETADKAKEIVNRAKIVYAWQEIRKPFLKAKNAVAGNDSASFIKNLGVLFKPGEKCNPEELLNAIGKVTQAKSAREAQRIAVSVTGKPVELIK